MGLLKITSPRISRFPTHLLLLPGFGRLWDPFPLQAEPGACAKLRGWGSGMLRMNPRDPGPFVPGGRESPAAAEGSERGPEANASSWELFSS